MQSKCENISTHDKITFIGYAVAIGNFKSPDKKGMILIFNMAHIHSYKLYLHLPQT